MGHALWLATPHRKAACGQASHPHHRLAAELTKITKATKKRKPRVRKHAFEVFDDQRHHDLASPHTGQTLTPV